MYRLLPVPVTHCPPGHPGTNRAAHPKVLVYRPGNRLALVARPSGHAKNAAGRPRFLQQEKRRGKMKKGRKSNLCKTFIARSVIRAL